jgi:colanic acid biosynthesis glycosyl transferase WcaI
MKILIHSLYFHPDQTGICKYSGEMAQWLAARGHRVEVVTGFPHYPQWKLAAPHRRTRFLTEQWSEVTVHRVPHYIPNGGKVSALQRMLIDGTFFLGSLVKWIALFSRRDRFDVVISVCPPMFTGIPALLSGWLRRVPWIYHVQDFQVDAALRLKMLNIGVLGKLLYALENFLMRRAGRVSSITDAMCRRAIAKGADAERTWLLPNWADVRGITPGPADNAFRRSLDLPPDSFLAIYAGAMGAKQGLDLVIEAADRLRGDLRFRFLMVGAGPEWQRLKDSAEQRGLHSILFLPVQPLEVLGDLLRAADVHLVIQKAEAADLVMPSKLTNILAVGRPAIATASEGTALSDVLEGAGTGCVVSPDDVNALVAALQKLGIDPDHRARMGENARRYAEANLDQDAILLRFEQQLIGLVREYKGALKE